MKIFVILIAGLAACAAWRLARADGVDEKRLATRADVQREAADREDAATWDQAQAKFIQFITPVVEKARVTLKDPLIHWAQVKHELLAKYLPDVRLYVLDGGYYADDPMIWVVSRDGQITDLGNGLWTGVNGNQWAAVEKVTAYVKGRQLKVETAQEAVQVVKLIEVMQSAPSFVGMLRSNTKDYTVFDAAQLKWMYAPRDDWKYTATKKPKANGGGWEVKVDYVGPPAGIIKPPVYEVVLDEQNRFADLQRR